MPYRNVRFRLLNLKNLILLLAFFVAFVTLVNGLYASYKVQKTELIKSTLETNHAYAQKLAAVTNNFIGATHQYLAVAASIIEKDFNNSLFLNNQAKLIHSQTPNFNSITIVNSEGVLIASSPDKLNILGAKLLSAGPLESLELRKPLVSAPYTSVSGNLEILISAPIFNSSGKYLGYLGGIIYLKEKSILNDLLGRHFHQDGSSIYVVDKNKKIIYHPEFTKVGSEINNNIILSNANKKFSDAKQVVNNSGIDLLVGYAPIASTGWYIVAQRSLEETLVSLEGQLKQIIYQSLPLGLLTFFAIWILANYISCSLRQLAEIVQSMDSPSSYEDLKKIKSWYFESKELKFAMLKGLTSFNNKIIQLKHDAATDFLTGSYNRRSLNLLLEQLEQSKTPFSVLALDIDYFKKINDTFGHPIGDKALVALAQVMHKISRDQDIVARVGGEEFLLVLPNTNLDAALVIAERLRDSIYKMVIEPIGSITVSIGVASSKGDQFKEVILGQADDALYQAKKLGRNRCEVYSYK